MEYGIATRAARCLSLLVAVALAGSVFFGLLSATSLGVSRAYAAPSDLASVQADLKKAKASLAKQQATLDKLAATSSQAGSRLAATEQKIAAVQAKIKTANKKLSGLATQLETRLRDIYMSRGSATLALVEDLFGGNGSLDRVITQLDLLSRVARSDKQLVADVKSSTKNLRELNAELARKKKQQQKDNAALAKAIGDSKKALESSKGTVAKLQARVRSLQSEEAKRRQELAAAKATATKSSKSGGGTPTTKGDAPAAKVTNVSPLVPVIMRAIVSRAASKYRLETALIAAVIEVESSWDPNAVSYAGYKGLMQIGPASATNFARQIAADGRWRDPALNIAAGSEELRYYIDLAHGDVRTGLAYYNGGPGNPQFGYAAKVLTVRTKYR
jgi:soluble lytic murein transglycosylase-like protein